MCGIFGIMLENRATVKYGQLEKIVRDLFLLSESRGKEASGVATLGEEAIEVIKSPIAASRMIKTKDYRDLLRRAWSNIGTTTSASAGGPLALIGHSRLVTTGSQELSDNNQPVIAGGAVGIHNGIVTNLEDLWDRYAELGRKYQVDTEIILCLLRFFFDETGNLAEAARRTFQITEGATSIAVLFEDLDQVLIATNNGSLFKATNPAKGVLLFASERWILENLEKNTTFEKSFGKCPIQQIRPGEACLINRRSLELTTFLLTGSEPICVNFNRREAALKIVNLSVHNDTPARARLNVGAGLTRVVDAERMERVERMHHEYPYEPERTDRLRRCQKCILPETVPFINFDEDGVCNYCREYSPLEFLGVAALQEVAHKYRSDGSRPDCVVGISGGRDSTYGLHYLKTVLKMNPVAYTFDWGMVTDLARRNISRICGKLGVEHILVSADITRKRRFIKKNVTAWLKKPELGMVPLFMAGDKQYFYFAQEVRRRTGAPVVFLCENMLERTDFKTGFAGVAPATQDKRHVYTLPLGSKVKLMAYYGIQYLRNPAYINTSLVDSAIAFGCYYLINRNYYNLYNYIPWIEEEVISTLIREYKFELSTDTKSTWRIGDGTSAFYNYIYYTIAGFSENDTLRSNQIRERLITREEALAHVREENRPRFAEIDWYLNIINMDLNLDQVLDIINAVPKLYRPA